MAYYDALAALWATLSSADTTAQKLATVNAMTVPGNPVDVPISAVVGYLGLSGKLLTLEAYAAGPPPGSQPAPIAAAKLFAAMFGSSNAPPFQMSQPAVYSAIDAYLNALTSDVNTGIAAADVTALLALAGGPPVPWWKANGYTSPFNENDLAAAGGLA